MEGSRHTCAELKHRPDLHRSYGLMEVEGTSGRKKPNLPMRQHYTEMSKAVPGMLRFSIEL